MEKQRKSIDLPWTAIIATMAALGGVFLYLNPLQTSRPTERSGFTLTFDRPQDVDARLWQDPLRTATEHESQLASRQNSDQVELENSRHSIQHFWDRRTPEKTWLLAVMIPGGSYSEYSEVRLRARQAVLEALGAEHFAPEDGEHIGYVKVDHTELSDLSPAVAGQSKAWNWRGMIVPFEWFERNAHVSGSPAQAELPDHVCVLWLRDEEFQTNPLTRLNWLLNDPGKCFAPNPGQSKIRIVGPRTSTILLAMVKEAAELPERQPLLQNVEMWSPTATASDFLLLHRVKGAEGFSSAPELFEKKLGAPPDHPFKFHRATVTDEEVIRVLLSELREKRGIKLGCEVGVKKCQRDRIALISEWDTFYGRALPLTFEHEVCGTQANIDQLLAGVHAENFVVFRYLRGIDGMLPEAAASSNDKNKEAAKKSSIAREQTEGLNQADYLRRLSRELANRNVEFQKNGEPGIKAVGVLGSDVYDKLLVLEALRGTLPDAIFFTNGLDARFTHPDEWRWTRNLIVASPFGLTISDGHGDKIPPFRDSNQTAYYTATLFAAGNQARDALIKDESILKPVRLYEIGRNGAFDLTVRENPGAKAPETIQPPSADIRRWWNFHRLFFTLGIVLCVSLGLVWALKVVVGSAHFATQPEASTATEAVPQPAATTAVRAGRAQRTFFGNEMTALRWHFLRRNRSTYRVLFSSRTVFVFLALFSIFWVWVIACIGGDNGEPYSWNDGISIWPTETLRLLSVLLSIFYIRKTWSALHRDEQEIQCHFFGVCVHKETEKEENYRIFSKLWWSDLIGMTTVRHWKCEEEHRGEHRVIAVKLWKRYLRCGKLKARVWRITPLIFAYVVAGILLMALLGWPSVPARGDWARVWDIVFLILSIGGSLFLTFYVADATLLNRRLIHYLTKGKTLWPDEAFTGLRGRWRLSEELVASEPGPDGFFYSLKKRWQETKKSAKDRRKSSSQEIPPTELLIDYLDIDLIAQRTAIVGGLIYYPFVIISLIIISRSAVFDHWTWPLPLLILLGFNAGYAAFSAIYLRHTAEHARQRALQRLSDQLIAYTAAGQSDGKEAKTIRETANLIRDETRGAFAAISQQPLARALLLPSGTAGIWALLQYFPRWFGN